MDNISITMKESINNMLRLTLVLLIFIGLQGRVVVRYLDALHCKVTNTTAQSSRLVIKEVVVHCKLQCYTQHFHLLGLPVVAFLLIILSFFVPRRSFIINYSQAIYFANWHIRRSPRGPPRLS
jgi:hypothetical protein